MMREEEKVKTSII